MHLLRKFIRRLIIDEAINIRQRLGMKTSRPQSLQVLKKFPKTLAKFDINAESVDTLPILGTGTRGVAVDVGGNRVLKLTDDEQEVRAAAKMLSISKKSDDFVKFFAVFRLGDTGYFGVLQEKLEQISNEEQNQLNNALKLISPLRHWLSEANNWNDVLTATKKFASENQDKIDEIKKAWQVINKFKIQTFFEELKTLGIQFYDYHGGNFMRRGDQLVLIDLGNSVVGGEVNIPIVKEVMKRS